MTRMTDDHKAALLEGREQGRMIRAYLAALQTPGRRGRKRTSESAARQLAAVEARLGNGVDPLTRVKLLQQRLDLEHELEALTQAAVSAPTLARLEEDFVRVAKPYSDRKGLTYEVWRQAGVPTAVLRRAGIYPERARTNGHGR